MMPKRSIDTKTFYLDKEVEKPVYCLDYIMKNQFKTALITEGPFDCLTAYSYGYPAIATWGNPSPEQINAINRSCLKTIYLAFDNDQAGQRFSRILKSGLSSRILIKEVQLPSHRKDLNDLTFEEFTKVMETAKKS
jgi:DNA primase